MHTHANICTIIVFSFVCLNLSASSTSADETEPADISSFIGIAARGTCVTKSSIEHGALLSVFARSKDKGCSAEVLDSFAESLLESAIKENLVTPDHLRLPDEKMFTSTREKTKISNLSYILIMIHNNEFLLHGSNETGSVSAPGRQIIANIRNCWYFNEENSFIVKIVDGMTTKTEALWGHHFQPETYAHRQLEYGPEKEAIYITFDPDQWYDQ